MSFPKRRRSFNENCKRSLFFPSNIYLFLVGLCSFFWLMERQILAFVLTLHTSKSLLYTFQHHPTSQFYCCGQYVSQLWRIVHRGKPSAPQFQSAPLNILNKGDKKRTMVRSKIKIVVVNNGFILQKISSPLWVDWRKFYEWVWGLQIGLINGCEIFDRKFSNLVSLDPSITSLISWILHRFQSFCQGCLKYLTPENQQHIS